MQRLDGKTPNTAKQTTSTLKDLLNEPAIRERIEQICPDAITDGELQMDLLIEAMGKYRVTDDITKLEVDDSERYEFRWSGKQKAKYESQKPSTGTLRPCPEESKNWNTTKNLYIEGDNLEVLKILQRAYAGKIKIIYIDPPYNTGHDFVYKDDYTDNMANYLKQTGQVDENGCATSTNTAKDGRFHTNWLNMMYPRLRLARNLLTEDGVIFISIDDKEQANLKKMCDEVFGSENFFTLIVVQSNKRGQTYKQIAKTHEHILVYVNSELTELNELQKKGDSDDLNLLDDIGKYNIRELRNRNPKFGKFNRPNLFYSIFVNDKVIDEEGFNPISLYKSDLYNVEVTPLNSKNKESCWRWGKELLSKNINDNTRISNVVAKIKSDGGYNIYEKYRKNTYKAKTIWDDVAFITEKGTVELNDLNLSKYFDFPKPVMLLKQILELSISSPDSIILDFFSGSATTAHAVMQLNAEDGGKRKFIMVQLPEVCDPEKDAAKAGYKNICEIGKERIRRAGDKIVEDLNKKGKTEDAAKLDTGFRVFKLSESNMRKWQLELADVSDKNEIEKMAIAGILAAKNTIRRDEIATENERRKEAGLAPFDIDLCVVFEWLLKYGVTPDCSINTDMVGGHKVYVIGGGAFMVCLEHGLNSAWARELIAYRDKCYAWLSQDDETARLQIIADSWHVMVADEAFANASDLINVNKYLCDNGLMDEHFIVV